MLTSGHGVPVWCCHLKPSRAPCLGQKPILEQGNCPCTSISQDVVMQTANQLHFCGYTINSQLRISLTGKTMTLLTERRPSAWLSFHFSLCHSRSLLGRLSTLLWIWCFLGMKEATPLIRFERNHSSFIYQIQMELWHVWWVPLLSLTGTLIMELWCHQNNTGSVT